MSIEALWAVQFTGVHGIRQPKSGGVIVLESGRIFGGDSWCWYTGKYERHATGLYTFQIDVGVHFTEGGQSIFGGPLVPLTLDGDVRVSDDQRTMTAKLTVDGSPANIVHASLTWVAPLP